MSYVFFRDVFNKTYKKTFKDVQENISQELDLFTEPIKLTHVSIIDYNNIHPSYNVTLYTNSFQISIDDSMYITYDVDKTDREVTKDYHGDFYLNLHNTEFIRITIKKKINVMFYTK